MADIQENTFLFGRSGTLLGVTTAPAGPERKPVACLFFNMGGDHRVGPRRINVKLARQLAAHGVSSIRFDLSGLGDSVAAPDAGPFAIQSVLDLQDAMTHLEQTLGIHRFVVMGLCSGAPSAMTVAATDPRVAGLLLFDGYAFPGRRARWMRSLRRYLVMPTNPAVLDKMVRWAMFKMGWAGPAEGQIYATESPQHKAAFFRDTMTKVSDKGVPTLLLYTGSLSAADRHLDQLGEFRDEPFARHAEYVFVREMDHLLTSQASQKAFLAIVGDWVLRISGATEAASQSELQCTADVA